MTLRRASAALLFTVALHPLCLQGQENKQDTFSEVFEVRLTNIDE